MGCPCHCPPQWACPWHLCITVWMANSGPVLAVNPRDSVLGISVSSWTDSKLSGCPPQYHDSSWPCSWWPRQRRKKTLLRGSLREKEPWLRPGERSGRPRMPADCHHLSATSLPDLSPSSHRTWLVRVTSLTRLRTNLQKCWRQPHNLELLPLDSTSWFLHSARMTIPSVCSPAGHCSLLHPQGQWGKLRGQVLGDLRWLLGMAGTSSPSLWSLNLAAYSWWAGFFPFFKVNIHDSGVLKAGVSFQCSAPMLRESLYDLRSEASQWGVLVSSIFCSHSFKKYFMIEFFKTPPLCITQQFLIIDYHIIISLWTFRDSYYLPHGS